MTVSRLACEGTSNSNDKSYVPIIVSMNTMLLCLCAKANILFTKLFEKYNPLESKEKECPDCRNLIDYLDKNRVQYKKIEIPWQDRSEIEKISGQKGAPVLVADGKVYKEKEIYKFLVREVIKLKKSCCSWKPTTG